VRNGAKDGDGPTPLRDWVDGRICSVSEPTGRPGRYQRSAGGLLSAMLILLLVLAAYVGFRALVRNDLAVNPEKIDYLEIVRYAQESGVDVVYPSRLPEDWIATEARVIPGKVMEWRINLLTEREDFVGIRQQGLGLKRMLASHVDEAPVEGNAVTASDGREWRVFTDTGGDTALASREGDEWLLVYGPAKLDQLVEVAGLLVDDRIRG